MKHVQTWLALLALSLPTTLPAGETDMNKDETAVNDTVLEMTTAFQSGDLDTVLNSYAPGAVVMFEPGAPVSDPKLLAETFAAWSAMGPEFTYAGHEVIVNGDTALHIAPWSMSGTGPNGAAIEQSGLSVAVLRRQEGGAWKMVIDNPHGQLLLDR